jgi:outer membrane beta-barrel protein
LFVLLAITLTSGCALFRNSDDAGPVVVEPDIDPDEPVLEPDLNRRKIKVAKIDREDFEIGVFGGALNVEDFGSDTLKGARLAYHVSESLFFEGAFAQSTVSDEAFRNISGGQGLFPNPEEDLEYYSVSLGFNILPGESFIGTRWARNSAMYILGGAGKTSFIDEDRQTYHIGFGLRVLPTDWLSLRLDARDNVFDSDLLGENKATNNFEVTFGLAIFF